MIICNMPAPPDDKQQQQKETEEKKFLRAGGRTGALIKGSSRGPRGPKKKSGCFCLSHKSSGGIPPVKWGLYWSHFFYFRTTHFATENINEREWRIICINYINYIHNIYYIYTYHIIVIIIFFITLPSWQFACCSCKNFINWVLFLASLPRN